LVAWSPQSDALSTAIALPLTFFQKTVVASEEIKPFASLGVNASCKETALTSGRAVAVPEEKENKHSGEAMNCLLKACRRLEAEALAAARAAAEAEIAERVAAEQTARTPPVHC
jgi:hypothetical protein